MQAARRYVTIAGVFLVLAFCASPVQGRFFGDKRELLREVTSFRVFIAPVGPEAKKMGLTEKLLQEDVEFQFKEAGIEISESSNTGLYINVSTLPVEGGPHVVYHIEIDLLDIVVLIRKPEVSCHAATWSECKTGILAQDQLLPALRKKLMDELDLFIYEYTAVNPKK